MEAVPRDTATDPDGAVLVGGFQVRQVDLDYLYNLLLERETPLSVDEMALALVRYRLSQEEAALAKKSHVGDVYRQISTTKLAMRLFFRRSIIVSEK